MIYTPNFWVLYTNNYSKCENKTENLLNRLGLKNKPTTSLQRGKTFSPNKYPGHDIKQSEGEAPVMLEFWGMQSTPLMPSLPGPLWLIVVLPNRVLSKDQIELFDI